MPPMDEDGNIIGMDDFQVVDADGNPAHLSAATILMCAPDVEHDCLPPLEAPPDMAWTLSDETAKRLMEFFDQEEKLEKTSIYEYLQKLCDEFGGTVEERDPPRRMLRKRIRWNERNRRRRLKGLQIKQNPYFGSLYYVINIQVPVKTVTCTVNWEVEEE